MQLTSLLRTAATLAVISMLSLLLFQTAQAQTETALYSFCSVNSGPVSCLDGGEPIGPLARDAYGTLYGTTNGGGDSCSTGYCSGTVFGLFPEPSGGCESGTNAGNGWCEFVLYNFCSIENCADGAYPLANVAYLNAHFSRPGNLYGTTSNGGASSNCSGGLGCGVVFEISSKPILSGCPSGSNTSGGWCEAVLYNFCSLSNCADGLNPSGNLVEDSAGNLYGTVANGVFELSPNGAGGWTEALIYPDGYVQGGLAIDASGTLYGVDADFAAGTGNVFKLWLSESGAPHWVAKNIHTFNGSPDGSSPNGPPSIDSAGNIYGTTGYGGSKNFGTVWKLSPVIAGKRAGTYKEKILHSFTAQKTGQNPGGGVTLDSSGNIYGTTVYGGGTECKGSCGTIFELALSSGIYKYKLLWSFDFTDGGWPYSNPIQDSAGNLYGVTAIGGVNNGGAVFEVAP